MLKTLTILLMIYMVGCLGWSVIEAVIPEDRPAIYYGTNAAIRFWKPIKEWEDTDTYEQQRTKWMIYCEGGK